LILNIFPTPFATRRIAANITATPTDIFRSVSKSSNNSGGIPVAVFGRVVVPTGIDDCAIDLNGNIRNVVAVARNDFVIVLNSFRFFFGNCFTSFISVGI
jgi:hypothetical protein